MFLVGFSTHLAFTVIFAEGRESNKISACVDKVGNVRILLPRDRTDGKNDSARGRRDGCRPDETAIDWNSQAIVETAKSTSSTPSVAMCPNCDISGAAGDRLSKKDFSNAIFTSAIFSGTNFSESNFTNANLSDSDLSGSNLTKVNFENALLSNAKLDKANATEANFKGADLSGAQLGGVTWSNTTCPDGSNSNGNNNTCEGHLTH
jgi:hypothetical protein